MPTRSLGVLLSVLQASLAFTFCSTVLGLTLPAAGVLALMTLHPLLATLALILALQRLASLPAFDASFTSFVPLMVLGYVQYLRLTPAASEISLGTPVLSATPDATGRG